MHIPESKSLILFDGVCNFCNASVNFIIERDLRNKFVFASLQSPLGQEILLKYDRATQSFDSLVLLENQHLYEKSTAALRIASSLKFPWNLFRIALILPTFARDPFYTLVANNRYRLFGRSETCRIPTAAEKDKILA